MQDFIDVITIPVSLIGFYAWWVFFRSWLDSYRKRLDAAKAAYQEAVGEIQ